MQIETTDQLDALPVGSVVMTSGGHVYQCDHVRSPAATWLGWYGAGSGLPWGTAGVLDDHPGPLTVLHVPGQPAPAVKPGREALLDRAQDAVDDKAVIRVRDQSLGGSSVANPREVADAVLALLLGKTEAKVKAEALREAVEDFESRVGVGDFEEQTIRDGIPWSHTAEAWEHQGPFMAWIRNRADELERGEGR